MFIISAIMPTPDPEEVRSILVWGPNWIGDIILSLPAVKAMKGRFPGSRLVYAARYPLGDLLSGEKYIDELVPIKRGSFFDNISLAKNLRTRGFDLAVALPNSFRAGLMLFLSGAGRRVGYASDHRGFLLTGPIPPRNRKEEGHRVQYFLEIAKKIGCVDPAPTVSLSISEEEKEEAKKILKEYEVGSDDLLICVHPGASKPPRTLAPSRFSGICRLIRSRWNARVLLIGGAQERGLLEEVRAGSGETGAFFINRPFSLRTTAAILERCDYFIGCDSGLMHLAAAVGAPVAGIFGPGVPEHTGPACEDAKKAIVFHRFPCAPCSQNFFTECRPSPDGRPPCIEEVRPEEVLAGLEALMTK
ncbi:MAG: glycosyltransferase family 9 protein [Nitrospinae bacterium]|nr:glycosyltransferase family 9 protein [Nitrospinota bacterium]